MPLLTGIPKTPQVMRRYAAGLITLLCLICLCACGPATNTKSTTDLAASATAASNCSVIISTSGPTIYDCSGSTVAGRVEELVGRASAGLGFPSHEGPREGDFMFVGKHYLAWIDNTGFSGKLNGLWPLNAIPDNLDFVLLEPTPNGTRPVSMLLPGEDGDGRWPRAYNGAEHYELPRYKNGRHDSQAGILEANHFTDAPAWWRECINDNTDPGRWDHPVGSTEVAVVAGGIRFRNEASMTIVARFHPDSFACGSPYPVDDTETTDLRLVSSYIMLGDQPIIERRYQLINYGDRAVANVGMEKLIGGQILTDWPHPHYLKQYQNFISWDGEDLKKYAPLKYNGDGQKSDFIQVRGTGTLTLSATPQLRAGQSISMQQEVDHAGEDLGVCLCIAHGGFEFTGSVLAGQRIAPRQETPGSIGPEQLRILNILGNRTESSLSAITTTVLNIPGTGVTSHSVGHDSGGGWAVQQDHDKPGFIYYRNYLPMTSGRVGQAVFYLRRDSGATRSDAVLEIDLVWNGRKVLAQRLIKADDFFASGESQRFVLDFLAPGTGVSGVMEPRVRWLGGASITLEALIVNAI